MFFLKLLLTSLSTKTKFQDSRGFSFAVLVPRPQCQNRAGSGGPLVSLNE